MKRREFLGLLGGAALTTPRAMAQTQGRIYHLGTLTPVAPMTEDSPFGKIVVKALAQRGYTVGQNLTWDARGSMGEIAKIPAMLEELKSRGIDAIVVIGYPTALAAKPTGIPTIGATGLGDPVETRLIDSLAHPGGNITGISDVATTLTTKRLQLLKEMSPKLQKVAMLWNRDDLGMTLRYEASAKVAEALGITVQAVGVREPDDFNEAFTAMDGDMPDAILMVADSLTNLNRKRVFDFATARKLPAIYEFDFLVRDGGLMSYGPDLTESFERTAALVDRIFKGASPGDLPFEQPTRYPFVLNLKTAKATGLEIPPRLVALADEVIE
ncbi:MULTISPECIES: ABC transporter substrate-binding protein [Bradyrhizobium]|jgi:putative ABC transport system substrate-binding protein|uniref:ABC transport system substrate-binding protein n=2 Tax=Bradyrhizobium TaxID=374 RepID=A0ABY0PAU4_9BRAD|nr:MULTISPECIES: ABC transporter substrate-binding protein [Bradyrhizobium]SDH89625.1 putative ABC transport system substrate-binding protein [Bradyrhizobium ottawaense]SED97589.1 putative ABC transport system substrate-binding protein [Bradyrhizobium lablabi]